MDTRYRHPQVATLWEKPWTYDAWWRIEQAVTRAQLDGELIPTRFRKDAEPLITNRVQPSFELGSSGVQHVDEAEVITKHDVAAFLQFVRDWWGEPHARWIHFGLTSSDLVDTAQGLRFKAMSATLTAETAELLSAADAWLTSDAPILGRTHGMPAEPTMMKVRAAHWVALLRPAVEQVISDTRAMRRAKISGPVGTYALIPPEVEQSVATQFGLTPVEFGGSQIAPRGNLGRWANSAAELVQACAKIAMDLRLMATHGEVLPHQANGQIGSSSMAHKRNPIRAEQVTGLARLAAGYASMLQPLDLWLERDISHSCVERVAVPDLWHILLHTIDQTTQLLGETTLNLPIIEDNLERSANAMYTRWHQLTEIEDGMSYREAREFALDARVETYDINRRVELDFLNLYPKDGS